MWEKRTELGEAEPLDTEVVTVFYDVDDNECMRTAVWRIFQALAINSRASMQSKRARITY